MNTEPTPNPADQPSPPVIAEEQMEVLLGVWRHSWSSGFVSGLVSAAFQAGMPDQARRGMAYALQLQADHLCDEMLEDPSTRQTLYSILEHFAAGHPGRPPGGGEIQIHCTTHGPGSSQGRGDDCDHR